MTTRKPKPALAPGLRAAAAWLSKMRRLHGRLCLCSTCGAYGIARADFVARAKAEEEKNRG